MVFERPLMLPCKPSPPPCRRPSSAPSTIACAGATAGRRGSSGRGLRRLQPLWTTTSEWLLVALLGSAPTNHLLPLCLAPPNLYPPELTANATPLPPRSTGSTQKHWPWPSDHVMLGCEFAVCSLLNGRWGGGHARVGRAPQQFQRGLGTSMLDGRGLHANNTLCIAIAARPLPAHPPPLPTAPPCCLPRRLHPDAPGHAVRLLGALL